MKVLVIDDDLQVLKQIEKVLAAAKGLDGKPFDVTTKPDHHAAIALLEEERREVVVTDMYMGPENDEGLAVLRQLTGKSPITIVLTAHPKIRDCVESMRAGAWDYLEKNPDDGSDGYDNLLQSIRRACRLRAEHRETGPSVGDTRWINENIDELMQKYPGEVVGILDQEVVGHNASFADLAKRMKKEFPYAQPAMVSIPDTQVDAIE